MKTKILLSLIILAFFLAGCLKETEEGIGLNGDLPELSDTSDANIIGEGDKSSGIILNMNFDKDQYEVTSESVGFEYLVKSETEKRVFSFSCVGLIDTTSKTCFRGSFNVGFWDVTDIIYSSLRQAGTHKVSVYLYDCDEIDLIFGTVDCGGDFSQLEGVSDDEILILLPLASVSKQIEVTGQSLVDE